MLTNDFFPSYPGRQSFFDGYKVLIKHRQEYKWGRRKSLRIFPEKCLMHRMHRMSPNLIFQQDGANCLILGYTMSYIRVNEQRLTESKFCLPHSSISNRQNIVFGRTLKVKFTNISNFKALFCIIPAIKSRLEFNFFINLFY